MIIATVMKILLVPFLCGLCSLILQLSLTRLIFFYVANSEHATALMITTHLFGFLIGACLKKYVMRQYRLILPFSIILAVCSIVLVCAFSLPLVLFDPIALIIIFVGALALIAAMFGFAVATLVLENMSADGATTIVIADSVGSAIGALVGGFVLLPYTGIEATLICSIVLIIILLWLTQPSQKRRYVAWLAIATLISITIFLCLPSDILRVHGLPLPLKDNQQQKIFASFHSPYGELSLVGPTQRNILGHNDTRVLYIDNRAMCTVTDNVQYNRNYSEWALGEFPAKVIQQSKQPPQMAVVGLGCGLTTAGALSILGADGQVDVIEINPDMSKLTAKLSPWLTNVMDDARLKLIIQDGFTYFMHPMLTQKYSAVAIDVAWMHNHNASHLFSREFYQAVKRSLLEDGVIAVWTEEDDISSPSLAILYKTLHSVFKEVAVNADKNGIILYGSDITRPLSTGAYGMRSESYWVDIAARYAPINTLNNLVLNRKKFSLLGMAGATPYEGVDVYKDLQTNAVK